MKIALFGASPRPDSLALKIQNRIISWNQTFFPINPKYEEIDGIKTYPDLTLLPEIPDLVVFMTNPQVSLALLDQVTAKKSQKSLVPARFFWWFCDLKSWGSRPQN